MKRTHLIFGFAFLGLSISSWAGSQRASAADAPTADEIASRTSRADIFGWDGAKTRVRMVLVSTDGKRQERSMEVLSRLQEGLTQTMVRFFTPEELAGTAFLVREQKGGDSEQYIYLSGLKRTRRISGREREGSFMGSDFTYADIERADLKRHTNTRLPDEKLGDAPTYVLESKVKDPTSTYAKLVTWVRKTDMVAMRTRFFDKQGKLLKTLYARKVKEIEGKPVVVEARMQSENGHATEMFVDSMERKDELPDSMFTPNALEH
jgi:hypothetical protein